MLNCVEYKLRVHDRALYLIACLWCPVPVKMIAVMRYVVE